MVKINFSAAVTDFFGNTKTIEKKYEYWEDKDMEKDMLKRFVVDVVSDESNELDHAQKIEIVYSVIE
jgi:hypothetical protein